MNLVPDEHENYRDEDQLELFPDSEGWGIGFVCVISFILIAALVWWYVPVK